MTYELFGVVGCEGELSFRHVNVQIVLGRNIVAGLRYDAGEPPSLKELVGFGVCSRLVSAFDGITTPTDK